MAAEFVEKKWNDRGMYTKRSCGDDRKEKNLSKNMNIGVFA